MIECDPKYLPMYKEIRQNSVHVIDYAENIDYEKLFSVNNVPLHIDYLQIDLEVVNMSTLNTLIKLDQQILSTYKFATVTFETDIYRGDYYNTRQISRDIFLNRGYIMVFSDVDDFEDWYVHPELVDMSYINRLIENNKKKYKQSSRTKGIESIHPNDIEF